MNLNNYQGDIKILNSLNYIVCVLASNPAEGDSFQFKMYLDVGLYYRKLLQLYELI